MQHTLELNQNTFTIEQIAAIAERKANVTLSTSLAFRTLIQRGADFLDNVLREDGVIYGVTTGYGDSCTTSIPAELVKELPHQLYTFHGCGLGNYFTEQQTRAIIASRIISLAKGYSGVSFKLLEQLTLLLHHDILPLIPSEGSVGASGDLTPLSYLAAVVCGEREVMHQGMQMPAAKALALHNIQPLQLRPKEGLALMNGTAVMTALACQAFQRADYLMQLCTRITSMVSFAMDGNAAHFNEVLFSVKPHQGQQQVAAWLRDDLGQEKSVRNGKRLQDRYSLRCAPHVIGVLADALPFLRQLIENELNSANDNPIIDANGGHILHGGHFYGGHIAFAMDSLKNTVANLADLLDRQLAQLVDTRFNNGLPANLSGASKERQSINHGLKALQISVSAWTAEALKLTMPASVFSRSTECHNQDKVSMGTIAARDCIRILELTEQVAAALLIAVRQGVELRGQQTLKASLAHMHATLSEDIPFIQEDRRLDRDLHLLLKRIQTRYWTLYANTRM